MFVNIILCSSLLVFFFLKFKGEKEKSLTTKYEHASTIVGVLCKGWYLWLRIQLCHI